VRTNEVVGEDAPIHPIDPEPSINALGETVAVERDATAPCARSGRYP
jgi:hypothetical protein